MNTTSCQLDHGTLHISSCTHCLRDQVQKLKKSKGVITIWCNLPKFCDTRPKIHFYLIKFRETHSVTYFL